MLKHIFIVQFFLLSSLLVTACGFQPLHGNGSESSVNLSQVTIPEQLDRTGQLIRNEILQLSRSSGKSAVYRLNFTKKENETSLIVSSNSGVNRKSLQLSVDYTLIRISNGKVVHKGTTFSNVAFDRTSTPFADYQARIDATERAAKEVGYDIRTRISAYLKTS